MYFKNFTKKGVLKKCILFFLLMLLNFNVTAQSKVEIHGSIVSNTGDKIVGATIAVQLNKSEFSAVTDSLGAYSLEVYSGNATIKISSLGYKSLIVAKIIKKKDSFDFTLEEEKQILNEVVITNTSKKVFLQSINGALKFEPKKLTFIPSLFGTLDVIKFLQLTPGVQNSGDANGYLYVRGGEPGHNLMLYAEAPVYGMAHLLGIFPFYNPDHINEVLFDKSNSNAKHGGRLSSTVQAIPNKVAPKEVTVLGVVGLLATQLSFSTPIGSKSGFYLSGRKTYIDEILTPLINSQEKNNDTSGLKYGFSDCNFTFISEFSPKSQFTVDAFISQDVLRMYDSKLNLNADLKWSNVTFSPSWKYKLAASTTITNSFYITRYENKLDMEQSEYRMKMASDVQDLGFTNTVKYRVKGIPFESGFQYVHHNLLPQKIDVLNLSTTVIDKEEVEIDANDLAVFVSAKPIFSNSFSANLGLRLNYYATVGDSEKLLHLEPRFLLSYKLNNDVSLFTSYTRQNQYLNLVTTSSVGIPTDFWVASSNGIPSQSSNEFSIGSNYVISKPFNCSLNGYFRTMKNLIEYPFGVTQFNEMTAIKNDILIGNGKAYGAEWMLKKEMGKFRGWLSYTLSWSTRQFDGLNKGEQFYSKYDRRHNLAVVGTYDLNKMWNFGVTQIFSSGNRFTMPTSWYFINNNPVKEYSNYNNAQMSNYIRTDLSVNYWLIRTAKKESSINFSLYNSFNIDNPIYVVLNVTVSENKNSISVQPEEKKLYSILPSFSWRFKF